MSGSDPRTQMAEWLSKRMQQLRLERIGEPVPENSVPFDQLPDEDQRNWLDLAGCCREIAAIPPPTAILRRQLDDFERYHRTLIADPDWRNERLRAMVVEMRAELDRIWKDVQ